MSSSNLFAAVVNRNSGRELVLCVRSLLEFLPPERIVVVDCASSDGSLAAVKPLGVRIESLPANLGYAGGNNRAMRLIRQAGGDLALIINPDARISAHDAALLAETLMDAPELGAIFPVVRKADNPRLLEAAYGVINHRHRLVEMIGEKGIADRDEARFFFVPFGVGCCFAVRVKTFLEVGGFDENFFAYQDEPDLCHRIRKAGKYVGLMPGAFATHKGIAGNEGRQLAKEYLVARNSVLFMKKNGGLFTWMKFLFFLAAGILYYLPGTLFGNKAFARRLQGFWDGFFRKEIRPEILTAL